MRGKTFELIILPRFSYESPPNVPVAVFVDAVAAELLQRVVAGLPPLLRAVVVALLRRPLLPGAAVGPPLLQQQPRQLDVVAAVAAAGGGSGSWSGDTGCRGALAAEGPVAVRRSMVACRPCAEPSLAVAGRPSQPAKRMHRVLVRGENGLFFWFDPCLNISPEGISGSNVEEFQMESLNYTVLQS